MACSQTHSLPIKLKLLYHTFPSARALMQLPRASRERLMLAPSRKRAPLFVVTVALSDPARSIKDILPTLTSADRLPVRSRCRINTWKIETIFMGEQARYSYCNIARKLAEVVYRLKPAEETLVNGIFSQNARGQQAKLRFYDRQ